MILVGGYDIDIDQLPFCEVMEYSVEPDLSRLGIKLKTIARSPTCVKVYIHSNVELPISDDIKDKVVIFSSEDDLIKLLEIGGSHEDLEVEDSIIEGFEEENHDNQVEPLELEDKEIKAVDDSEVEEIEEVDDEILDDLLQIPYIDENMDNMKKQLELKDRIIEQKDGIISDLKTSIDDLYKLQERQLLDMKSEYEKKIDEANKVISDLSLKADVEEVSNDVRSFGKYLTYANSYKAVAKDGFTQDEIDRIQDSRSKLYIFASGTGESFLSMMTQIRNLINSKTNALIVDFSGDPYLTLASKMRTKDSSMQLLQEGIGVIDVVKDFNDVKIVPTTNYNDLALLSVDWIEVINKLYDYAAGNPIILIFNSISSFNVRYTISKLSTIGELVVFVKSSPVILSSLLWDLSFIPSDRFRVVALDYIDEQKLLLERIKSRFTAVEFKNSVKWGKIGVKV